MANLDSHRHAPGLTEKWEVRPDGSGGGWNIVSTEGSIICYDIPFGAYADHIAALHNDVQA